MSRRVFISVGEVSGDQHAALLIRELKLLDKDIIVEGIGGPAMAAAGAMIHYNTVNRAAMGLKAFLRYFELNRILKWTRNHYRQRPPDLAICVDSWTMNWHWGMLAKEMRIPVLYYVAPQMWASRPGRVKKLRKFVDRVACILPFEEKFFRDHGVEATFVGHPLFDEIPPHPPFDPATALSQPPAGDRRRSRLPVGGGPHQFSTHAGCLQYHPPLVPAGDFPGADDDDDASRRETLPRSPVWSRSADRGHRNLRALYPRPESVQHADPALRPLPDRLRHRNPPCRRPWRAANRCLSRQPHRLAPPARWLIKTRTYSLVNLLNDSHQTIVPEFVPWYGSNQPVADKALEYLNNPDLLLQQRERVQNLLRTIAHPGASRNAARLAKDLMDGRDTTLMGPG